MNLSESSNIYLIVGLGNPGREYKGNRHNIGFMVLDCLAARLGTGFGRLQSHALVAKGEYQERRLILAKPQTYMNLSGQAVGSLARFYKVPLENSWSSTTMSTCRWAPCACGPMAARPGRKGCARSSNAWGQQVIPRLRVGIGRPPGRMDAAAYVLQDFSREEATLLPQILERASEAALTFVTRGLRRP